MRDKEKEERDCGECFLRWYSQQHMVNYTLRRTESVYPELEDNIRWDFTAISSTSGEDQLAIEVKQLIRPQTRIQLVRWNKILNDIAKKLRGKIKGQFLIWGTPVLELDQNRLAKLRKILLKIILENSKTLKKGQELDLGPQILSSFPEWPSTPFLETEPSPHIEHKVQEQSRFTILKSSESGCLLELAISPVDVFHVEKAVSDAIDALFKPVNGILHANEQLGAAKEKGCKISFLLLDCHILWRPNIIRGIFRNKTSGTISNIDAVYLVETSQKRVAEI